MNQALKPNQLEALATFAKENGRNWKQALRAAWMSGDYEGFEYSGELQCIRNTFGPSWLVSFNLKKAIAQSSESLEELASQKPALKPVSSNTGLLETIAAISADIDSKPAEQKYSLTIRIAASGHCVAIENGLSIGEVIESLRLWCVNGSYSAEITPAQ